MSHVSEGRISALAHLVLAELKAADVDDLRTDRLVLNEIKAVRIEFEATQKSLARCDLRMVYNDNEPGHSAKRFGAMCPFDTQYRF